MSWIAIVVGCAVGAVVINLFLDHWNFEAYLGGTLFTFILGLVIAAVGVFVFDFASRDGGTLRDDVEVVGGLVEETVVDSPGPVLKDDEVGSDGGEGIPVHHFGDLSFE